MDNIRAAFKALAVLACALFACGVQGCSKVSTSASNVKQPNPSTVHGVVRLAILAEPNTLNPVLSGVIQEGYVEGAIFNGLLKFDDHNNLVPDLATVVPSVANGGIGRDGKTIVYHLHHSVTWQDGQPFTSADVAFTYRMYTNPKVNGFYLTTYSHITSLDTPDPYTVVLHLKQPFAPGLMQFFERNTGGFVIPKHLLASSPDFNRDPFGKHPLGTGPFMLDRWEHGSLIVLKANPHYFGGAPKLREIDVHIIGNPNTQLAEIESHELDVAAQLTPTQYAQIAHVAGVHAVLVQTYLERFVTFNLKHEPFGDIRVRRALALAIDRNRIQSTAYVGTGTTAQTLIPPSSWAYEPDNGAAQYDPSEAKALLDKAGWLAGPDGVRRKNGRPLSFGLLNQTESNPLRTMAQEIQRAWREIGVDVDLRQVPRNVIYSNEHGLATDGRFDALVDDWGADPDPDRSLILATKSFEPHGYNTAFYSDPDVDAWSAQGVATYDLATRKRLYSLIQKRVNRDMPYVPLVWDGRIYAVNTDLNGFLPEPVATDFWNAETWQI